MSPHSEMNDLSSAWYEQEESTEFTTGEKRKSVSFNREVLAYRHIHVNDFSDEEFDRSWYIAEELASMKSEILRTVRLMVAGNCPDNDLYCPRGLEYRTPAGAHLRRAHKYAVWDAVEDEQARQWSQGICDAESIARVYHACAELCCDNAIRLAREDASFVQHELEGGRFFCQNVNCASKKPRDKSKRTRISHRLRCRSGELVPQIPKRGHNT